MFQEQISSRRVASTGDSLRTEYGGLIGSLSKELSSNKEAGNLSIVKPSNGDDGFLIVSPHPINPVYNTILTVLIGSGKLTVIKKFVCHVRETLLN